MRIDFNLIKRIVDKIAIIFSFLQSGSDYQVVVERKEKEKDTSVDSSVSRDNNIAD